MRLGMSTSREIYPAHFRHSQKAGKTETGKILDERTGTTGLNRDHRAPVVASYGKPGRVLARGSGGVPKARRKRGLGKRGGRPPKYQEPAFIGVLTRLWEDHGRPCGKLLAAMLRELIDFLVSSREADNGSTNERKALLVKVSGAPIDRLLAPARKALELRGDTHDPGGRSVAPLPGAGANSLRPGAFAFDTVAHADVSPSGAGASGQFCKTYALNQPLFGVGSGACPVEPGEYGGSQSPTGHPPQPALPFTAGQYDHGRECIHTPLLAWCLQGHSTATLSRPYRKNHTSLRTSGPSGAEKRRCGSQDGGVFPV